MDIVASVVDGDMRYAVAERQADDSQPFLGFEQTIMPEVLVIEIPITVSNLANSYFFHCYGYILQIKINMSLVLMNKS